MGVIINVGTAYLISRVKVQTLAVVSAMVTIIASPLMATVKINENYWFAPFWALFLSPVNPDGKFRMIPLFNCATSSNSNEQSVLFTVSNLVISDAFPRDVQSLAGGVFSEVSQFGNAVGLAVTAAIAASVTEHSDIKDPEEALMKGYRAAFWTTFASTVVVLFVCFFGLKKGGFVGKKDD